MQNNDPFNEQPATASKEDLKAYINKIVANWYLFILSALVCTLLAFVYAKFIKPEYKIKSKILVKDEKNNPASATKGLADLDLSSLLGTTNSTEAEIEIINSRALMTSVVNALHLNIVTSIKGKIGSTPASDKFIPFRPSLTSHIDSIEPRKYIIDQVTNKTFHIVGDKEGVNATGTFGTPFKLPQFNLLLMPKHHTSPANVVYQVTVQSVDSKVEELMSAFDVQLSTKQSPVIDLTLSYPVPDKGEQILTTLMHLYLKENLEDKVKIADSTLSFIDAQLRGVTKDLGGVESQIESFKTRNQLADIDEQSKALISNSSDYFKKLNDIEVQVALINDLSKYINNPANHRIIPSNFTIPDPVFAAAITTYNQLLIQRERASMSYGEDHPIITNLDQQIESSRRNLIKSFNEYKNTLELNKQELVNRNSTINNKIKSVPSKEREFLDFSRQQTVKQQLYIYLLEKREETAISRTSTFSTSQIIDPAKSSSAPYSPKKAVIYLFGFIIGLVLPLGYLSLKDILNNRVRSKNDITSVTQVPVVGEISHDSNSEVLLTNSSSRSILAEQFRSLRINLKFLFKSEKPQVIMITSSMSGEGKSFISVNLGGALAVSGKKVVLLEFDLRKPKLSSTLGLEHETGFTNWVISDQMHIDELIKPIAKQNDVSIISSGPVPPNPAELLESPKVGVLIEELKKRFDYIIIDTAPIGLVSDAFLLEKLADVTLYIIRQGYTFKSQLPIINDLTESGKIKRMYLVVNDIRENDKGGYYGYGYSNRAYGYGDYVSGNTNKKIFFGGKKV